MKNKLILLSVLVLVTISACKKTDNAANWVGTYTSGTPTDSVNQVTITEVNSTTLTIQLQAHYGSVVYTYATLQQVPLQSATTLTIDETGNIAGYPALYQFTGSGVLSGNSLTLSGQAVNTVLSSDVKAYYFSGGK